MFNTSHPLEQFPRASVEDQMPSVFEKLLESAPGGGIRHEQGPGTQCLEDTHVQVVPDRTVEDHLGPAEGPGHLLQEATVHVEREPLGEVQQETVPATMGRRDASHEGYVQVLLQLEFPMDLRVTGQREPVDVSDPRLLEAGNVFPLGQEDDTETEDLRKRLEEALSESNALLEMRVEDFEARLQELILNLFSYYDFAKNRMPEAVIQAFTLGLLANLTSDFRIRSNRETGKGRADLILAPRRSGQAGFVIEFKAIAESDDPDNALNQALVQSIL